jgi:2-C-methyl-D-erythritol 2,4-cyclodiphosphate synthase
LKLLGEVGRLLGEKGFAVVNVDGTLLAQAPKVAPYKDQMAENIAAALGIEADQVNIKATTEEGLGFTGDGSGMVAHAVVLVEAKS